MSTVVTLATPWLSAFVLALLAVIVPLAYAKGLSILRARHVNTTLYEAIGRAGGAAYAAFISSGKPVTDRAALSAAAAAGGAYLQATVPDALAASGVTDPARMAQIAGAELGKLLALDPSVKAPAA